MQSRLKTKQLIVGGALLLVIAVFHTPIFRTLVWVQHLGLFMASLSAD
jgi:hypothetical protein